MAELDSGEDEGFVLSGGTVDFGLSQEQIRHRDRVRDLAEVYTHRREVTAMLDMVADMFPTDEDAGNHDRTFLEPACGHGNFLVEILRRKLRTVTSQRYGVGDRYEYRVLRCIASIYGIDIDQGNVLDSRERLRAVIASHVGDSQLRTEGFWSAVDTILNTNILRADTLADAHKIELVSYRPVGGGAFIREWSSLQGPDQQLDLFDLFPGEPQKDDMPVHYGELAANPKPNSANRRAR